MDKKDNNKEYESPRVTNDTAMTTCHVTSVPGDVALRRCSSFRFSGQALPISSFTGPAFSACAWTETSLMIPGLSKFGNRVPPAFFPNSVFFSHTCEGGNDGNCRRKSKELPLWRLPNNDATMDSNCLTTTLEIGKLGRKESAQQPLQLSSSWSPWRASLQFHSSYLLTFHSYSG